MGDGAENAPARTAYAVAEALRDARMPVIRPLHGALYGLHLGLRDALAEAAREAWWTPLFVSRLETAAPGLRRLGGMPQVLGPLRLRIGRGVRRTLAEPACARLQASGIEPAHIRGKFATLNEAIAAMTTEVAVLTNVSAMLPPDAVRRAAAHFADPRLGRLAAATGWRRRFGRRVRLPALPGRGEAQRSGARGAARSARRLLCHAPRRLGAAAGGRD